MGGRYDQTNLGNVLVVVHCDSALAENCTCKHLIIIGGPEEIKFYEAGYNLC